MASRSANRRLGGLIGDSVCCIMCAGEVVEMFLRAVGCSVRVGAILGESILGESILGAAVYSVGIQSQNQKEKITCFL